MSEIEINFFDLLNFILALLFTVQNLKYKLIIFYSPVISKLGDRLGLHQYLGSLGPGIAEVLTIALGHILLTLWVVGTLAEKL